VVQRLAADGTAVVYTTHYLTELTQLAAGIAVLHEGRIAARMSVAELLARYDSLDAAFLAITGTNIEGNSNVPVPA
jgi:ABC-2 type transport system ATP-binding protein